MVRDIETLEAQLRALPPAPRRVGRLDRIVIRPARGERQELSTATVTVGGGIDGDRWGVRAAQLGERVADREVTLIRTDFAAVLAGEQSPRETGDNLHVWLDISEENLPPGSRLRIGAAVLEVSPKRHSGCQRFRERFGAPAGAVNGRPAVRGWRVRGLLLRVVEGGTISVGAPVVIESARV